MDVDSLELPGRTEIASIEDIQRKMHLTGKVVKTTLAGAIVDIGLDTPGVVHISQLRKEPVNRVEDVVQVGKTVDVWVRRVEPKRKRIDLTMIEPLPLEWHDLEKGKIVKGKVSRIEKFGVFLEIGAERPGFVHVSELTHGYIRDPHEVVKEGDEVEAKVIEVNRRRKQIKLSMKDLEAPKVIKEKPAPRRKRKPIEIEKPAEAEKEEEVTPTAMEIALREAMLRSKEGDAVQIEKTKRKQSGFNQEIEQILSRTLQHKVKTASK